MKKVLLVVAFLMGGTAIIPSMSFPTVAQTCDPNSPCLYTGTAVNSNSTSSVSITVKMDRNGNYIAEVANKGTFYVFESRTDDDKSHGAYYINIDGRKYYFNM